MDVVFHLHGLKHAYCVAGIHGVAYAHLEIHYCAGERTLHSRCRTGRRSRLVDHLFAGFSAGCGGRTLHRRGDGGSLGCLVLVEFHGVGRSVDHHLCLVVDNISDTDGELDAVDFILVFFEFHFRESERN